MIPSIHFTPQDAERVTAINAAIPGWSDNKQYAFFKGLLGQLPWIGDMLIVGVYQGRDIAYILDIATRYHPGRKLRIVGVDKFSDTPCDDWPEEKRGLDWKAAGFGEAPGLDRAWGNLSEYMQPVRDTVSLVLVKMADADYLETTGHQFDFVYLDTSHDHATVARQLAQVPRLTRHAAVIAGDDYSDAGTWGVKRAVGEAFTEHSVFAGWLWYSERRNLKALAATL